MTLSIGQTYKDRGGNTWTILKEDKGFRYPFVAQSDKGWVQSFTSDGRWSHHTNFIFDLRVG